MNRSGRRGQAATEYFLLIAVFSLGALASAYLFIPGFQQGMQGLGSDMEKVLKTAMSDGSGSQR